MDKAKEKNFLSAVLYVRNDETRIADFLKMLLGVLEENFEHSELICVNDFSSDSSVEKIKSVCSGRADCAVTVLNLSYFHGVETAMNAGVDLSIGDFVLEIDTAVYDYDKDEIMSVYQKVLEGNDIVSASPDRKQKFSSEIFYRVYKRFSATKNTMRTETFRILTRRAINRIEGMSRTLPYRKAVYLNCGLKTLNVSYHVTNASAQKNDEGELKRYRKDLAFETLILFTNAGYFVTKLMTSIMMIVSLFMIIYTIVIYASANPIEGWTTTILFLSVAFFGLFAILTIVVRYLQILVDLNFKRTRYSFESIEKL